MPANYKNNSLEKLISEKNLGLTTPVFSFFSSYSFNSEVDIIHYRGVKYFMPTSEFSFSLFYDGLAYHNEIPNSLSYQFHKYKIHHMRIFNGLIEVSYILTEKIGQ